jgi:MYXO-CTERM domain-containing protein
MMLLSFTSAEILKQVTIGWSGTDGDFQVLAWMGASNASLSTVQNSIVNQTAASMLTGGWSLVTTVNGAGNISTPDVNYAVNSGNVSSSYWLISAFNSAFGGTGATTGADAIKVLAVATQGPGQNVPLPNTLALAGLGLFAIARMRRRAQV